MYCKVTLIGNVGQDPNVRTLESGIKTASFSLATSEKITDRNNNTTTHTEWHNIVLWRTLADVADKYVRKGSQVFIEGRLRSREWTDRDGQKHTATEIIGDVMKLLGKRNDAPTAQPTPAPAPQPAPQVPETPNTYNDGLPF